MTDARKEVINRLKGEKIVLSGCISKNGHELDGGEFECETLDKLMSILKDEKEIHLNFYGEENIDIWLTQNE